MIDKNIQLVLFTNFLDRVNIAHKSSNPMLPLSLSIKRCWIGFKSTEVSNSNVIQSTEVSNSNVISIVQINQPQ